MRSIVYAGNDFSEVCSAEVVRKSANPIVAECMQVPGRAGALLVSGYMPPVDVTVRLFLDMGFSPGGAGMAQARSKVRRWLSQFGGGELVLPDDSEVAYRDALLVGASDWSSLFEDGECELTFTLFDPIGYGEERVERTGCFAVGGNWPTLPEFRMVAAAGAQVRVSHPAQSRAIVIDYEFAGGEEVVIDCADESVSVGGADARESVTLGSDFFSLEPGDRVLSVTGATSFEARFFERWA